MRKSAKKNILIHSEAKLELYRKYLDRYLKILVLTPFIKEINIFDLFCGTGVYDDGKHGSPIIAFDIINSVINKYQENIKDKKIRFFISDKEQENINKVENFLKPLNKNNIELHFTASEFNQLVPKITNYLNKQKSDVRNLFFLDPYGYKEIKKNEIISLIENKKTELIIFLPISHMHRFKDEAIKDYDNPSYIKLREFISQFIGNVAKNITVFEFIKLIKTSLSFNGEYYSSAHYIKRNERNYNGIFYISSNIYGLEKFIEVQWEQDTIKGEGFDSTYGQANMFGEDLNELKNLLQSTIGKNQISNSQLYELTLLNGYLPKHTNKMLEELREDGIIKVFDENSIEITRKNTFYVNFNNFQKNKSVYIIKTY